MDYSIARQYQHQLPISVGIEDEGHALTILDDGTVVATTEWMFAPGGGEQRQYRVRRHRAGVDCEIRLWRDGCRPGAWEHVGTNPGGVKRAIQMARDLQHVTEAFLALYEMTLIPGDE